MAQAVIRIGLRAAFILAVAIRETIVLIVFQQASVTKTALNN